MKLEKPNARWKSTWTLILTPTFPWPIVLSQTTGPLGSQKPRICSDTIRQIFALLFCSFSLFSIASTWPADNVWGPMPGAKGSFLLFHSFMCVAAIKSEESRKTWCMRWFYIFAFSANGYSILLVSQAKPLKSGMTTLFFSYATSNPSENPFKPYPSKYIQNWMLSYHIHGPTWTEPSSPPILWQWPPRWSPAPTHPHLQFILQQ